MLKKFDKEAKEKEIMSWYKTLPNMAKIRAIQPYFPNYSIADHPLITLFRGMNFQSKLEIYENEKEKNK